MEASEVNQKLHYVIELLGDLWHHHQAGAHACTCNVCTKKQSLARSIIAKALQEVVVIANFFESDTDCDKRNTHPSLNNSSFSYRTLPTEQDVENAVLKDSMCKVQGNTEMDINSSCSTLRSNNRDEKKSSSVSIDSLRDSGLNTSLSSQSVSPIIGGRCQHRCNDNTQLLVTDSVNATSSCDVNTSQSPQDTSRDDPFSSSNGSNRALPKSHRLSIVQANRTSHLPVRHMCIVEDDSSDILDRQIVPTDSQQAHTSHFSPGNQARSEAQISNISPGNQAMSSKAQASHFSPGNQATPSSASQGLMFLSFPLVSPPSFIVTLEDCCRHSEQSSLSHPNDSCENTANSINHSFSHQVHCVQKAPMPSVYSCAPAEAYNPLINSVKGTSEGESSVTNTVLERADTCREGLHRHLSKQEAQLQNPMKQKTDFSLQDEHSCSSRSNEGDGCVLAVDKPSPHCLKENHTEQQLHCAMVGSNEQIKLYSGSTKSVSGSLSRLSLKDSCNHHQLFPDTTGTDGCGCHKSSSCERELCENIDCQDDSHVVWRPWQAKDLIVGLINSESDDEKHTPQDSTNTSMPVYSDKHVYIATDAAFSDSARINESVDSAYVTTMENDVTTAQVQDMCGIKEQPLLSSEKIPKHTCQTLKINSRRKGSQVAPSSNSLSSGNSVPYTVNVEQGNQDREKVVDVNNHDVGMVANSEKSFDITNIRIIDEQESLDATADEIMKHKGPPINKDSSLKCLSNIVQLPKNSKSYIYNSSTTSPDEFRNRLSLDKENSNICIPKPNFKSAVCKMSIIDIESTDKPVRHKQFSSSDETLPTVTSVNPSQSSDVKVHLDTNSALDLPISCEYVSQSQCKPIEQEVDMPLSNISFSRSESDGAKQVDMPISSVRFTQSESNSVNHRSGKLSLSSDHSSRTVTPKSNNQISWGAPAVMVDPDPHTDHKKTNCQVEMLPRAKYHPDLHKPANRLSKLKPEQSDEHHTSEVGSKLSSGSHVTFVTDGRGETTKTNESSKSVRKETSAIKSDLSNKHCTSELTSSSSTVKHETFRRDARGELTENNESMKATCKDIPTLKASRNHLNQTLPTCKTLETRNTRVHKTINESYEANQSFPKVTKSHQSVSTARENQATAAVCSHGVGTGMHQLSSEWSTMPAPRNRRSVFGFSPPDPHCSPEFRKPDSEFKVEMEGTHQNRKSSSADESGVGDLWSLLDVSDEIGQIPSIQEVLFNCVTSSLCIVDSERNGKILSLNESFQFLIGVHERVVGQKLFRFIKFGDFVNSPLGQSLPQNFVLADGHIASVTGSLAHCVNASGEAVPVSVWTVPFKPQPRLTVCVIGVTQVMQADVYLSGQGQVLMYSQPFEDIMGSAKEGEKATYRIPDVDYSQAGKPQQISLETRDGCHVPVMLTLGSDTDIQRNNSSADIYSAVLSVSMNLCGLLVSGPDGVIRFWDQNYFRINLGHSHLEDKFQVSDFLSEIMRVSPSSTASSPESSPVLESKMNLTVSSMALADVSCLQSGDAASARDKDDISACEFCLPQSCFSSQGLVDLDDSVTDESDDDNDDDDRGNTSVMEESEGQDCVRLQVSTVPYQTSTPCKGRDPSKHGEQKDVLMERGTYVGLFLHGDGSHIPVMFKLSHIQTDSETLFCLWLCVMPGGSKECDDSNHSTNDSENDDDEDESEVASTFDEEELGKQLRHLHLNKPEDTSVGQIMMDQAGFNQSHNATSDADLLDLEVAVSGSFGNKYAVCEALGQGSFGFVRRAKIVGSASTVVVKFIKKSHMFEDSWVNSESSGKKIPLEVAILRETYNEHIIKVLDFHENDSFVQMVMEDFGETDLFDFIDQVEIDEPLACYLFRQILWAVDYLHSKKIIHRDIKDENVIVSRSFHCKLIDFGSATYMLPTGEMFTKFRGTMEYCSPEVHSGAKYRGPELDVWALGVTLYTILFRENPFTASEVPGALNDLPHPITADAMTLLLGLLQPDPLKRFTVLRALSCDWLRQIVDLNNYSWCDMFGDVPAPSDSMYELDC